MIREINLPAIFVLILEGHGGLNHILYIYIIYATFPSRPDFRLINPSKSNIGRISKLILERINKDLREKLMVNLWRSTGDVLEWFNNLTDKEELRFVQFDIQSYYPSITPKLLKKAIQLAKEYTSVTEEEEDIIIHSRKAVVTDNSEQIWTKKEDPDFDVTMGAYDGGECAELVGLLILKELKSIIDSNLCGLYRDDGLCVVRGGGQAAERMKQKIFSILKQLNLKITADANLMEANFLDVTFNIADGSFRPYIKPNCSVKYVSRHSNHPPLMVQNIPISINKRLSCISSNKESFEEEKMTYQAALVEAGYNHKLEFQKMDNVDGKRKKRRRQNVTWFNPPFSHNIKTNIGKKFFAILHKHFPEDHELHHLFNKRTVKLSYSCMPAMKSIISSHNKKILNSKRVEQTPGCNCRGGVETCPLKGMCKMQSLVYKAEVSSSTGVEKEYLGQTNVTFKTRWNNHKNECKLPHKEKATCLSKYIWQLKREETDYTINWSVACVAGPYSRETKKCQLCIMEKTLIALQDNGRGLNRRREILTKCWHKDKHVLANWLEAVPVPTQGGQIAELQGGGPPSPDAQDDGELREDPIHPDPDPDEPPGGAEGGDASVQKELSTAGPITRSKAKKMRNL